MKSSTERSCWVRSSTGFRLRDEKEEHETGAASLQAAGPACVENAWSGQTKTGDAGLQGAFVYPTRELYRARRHVEGLRINTSQRRGVVVVVLLLLQNVGAMKMKMMKG